MTEPDALPAVNPNGDYVIIPKRTVRVLTGVGVYIAAALTVLIILVVPSLGTNERQSRQIAEVTEENRTALCALRGDVERRVSEGNKFLKEHPQGIAGIDPGSIRISIINEERTVIALEILKCGSENRARERAK